MLNIKKIAATGLMALIIGGAFVGGFSQAPTASADGGGVPGLTSTINVEGSGVPGINVEGGGVPGIDVKGGGVLGIPVEYDGIKCEDDECLRLYDTKTYESFSSIFITVWK